MPRLIEKLPSIAVTTSTGSEFIIHDSNTLSWATTWPDQDKSTLIALSNEMEEALRNPSCFWSAIVTAQIHINPGQQIYPSQVYETERTDKQLFTVQFDDDSQAAAFTYGKIGAGISMIDDWYSSDNTNPIRVNEYGADRQKTIALRRPKTGLSFYDLIQDLETYIDELQTIKKNSEIISNESHFLMSVLVKGGVFGKK